MESKASCQPHSLQRADAHRTSERRDARARTRNSGANCVKEECARVPPQQWRSLRLGTTDDVNLARGRAQRRAARTEDEKQDLDGVASCQAKGRRRAK
eukprot:6179701-Pleurochrysis_carterae.AAC.3